MPTGSFQLIPLLKVYPEFRCSAKAAPQPQGNVCREAVPLVGDLVDTGCGYAEALRKRIGKQTQRLHEFFTKDLTWMDRRQQFLAHGWSPSLIPSKAN
jgi:hypothetical protein